MSRLLRTGFLSLAILLGVTITGLPGSAHAQQVQSHAIIIATQQPGLDQDATRAAIDWWGAMLARDVLALARVSGDPIYMRGKSLNLEEVLERFEAPCCSTTEAEWPIAIVSANVMPAIDPVSGAVATIDNMPPGLLPLPEDRIVQLTMAEKKPDGTVKSRQQSIRHYAQHIQAGDYRIIALTQ